MVLTLKLHHNPNKKRLKSLADNFVSLDQETTQNIAAGAFIQTFEPLFLVSLLGYVPSTHPNITPFSFKYSLLMA